MSDLVALALDHAPRRPGDGNPTAWSVTFVTGDMHIGALSWVAENVYRINKEDGSVVFFDAPKVAYLSPHQ